MNPRYPTNVKIPEEYVTLIDENLKMGGKRAFGKLTRRSNFSITADDLALIGWSS